MNSNRDLVEDVGGAMMTAKKVALGDGVRAHRQPRKPVYIVQKYIQNKLLLDAKPFHLNLFCLVTSCKPLTFFLHERGLLKLFTQGIGYSSFEA